MYRIRVVDNGVLEVQESTTVVIDGVERVSYHRTTVAPGDGILGLHPDVVAMAKREHTPARIAAYQLVSNNG